MYQFHPMILLPTSDKGVEARHSCNLIKQTDSKVFIDKGHGRDVIAFSVLCLFALSCQ